LILLGFPFDFLVKPNGFLLGVDFYFLPIVVGCVWVLRPSSVSGGNYGLVFDSFSLWSDEKKVTTVLMFDLEFWNGSRNFGGFSWQEPKGSFVGWIFDLGLSL
jgi:hypothetical protein